jgi:hypothetical protein
MASKTKATILVVDDEPEVRKLVCAMAAQLGYHVLTAGSGPRALTLHKLFRPIDLLVTDVVMQGMSGPVLAERMTNLQPGLKVLYMTGYEHSRVVQTYVVETGHPLLSKPFSMEDFGWRLRVLLAPAVKSTANR